jgi:hypothetical protein
MCNFEVQYHHLKHSKAVVMLVKISVPQEYLLIFASLETQGG